MDSAGGTVFEHCIGGTVVVAPLEGGGREPKLRQYVPASEAAAFVPS
jgi:hypothetical protein